MDDTESRYMPSSIYSGNPNESRATSGAAQYNPMALQGSFQENQPRYNPVSTPGAVCEGILTMTAEPRTPPKLRPSQHPRSCRHAFTHGNGHH